MMEAVGLGMAPTDAELVAAARGGDAAGFGTLLERHRPGMRAVALSLLGWHPDAEDVVINESARSVSFTPPFSRRIRRIGSDYWHRVARTTRSCRATSRLS